MVKLGLTVFTKKAQKGTITKIITKSTGYVEVTLEDGTIKKEMAFNLTDVDGKPVRKAPKKAVEKPLSPMEQLCNRFKFINACCRGDRNGLSYQLCEEDLANVEMAARAKGNEFIQSVAQSVLRWMSCSDKQAFCLARFCVENDVKF